jgi:hypothetical protein
MCLPIEIISIQSTLLENCATKCHTQVASLVRLVICNICPLLVREDGVSGAPRHLQKQHDDAGMV